MALFQFSYQPQFLSGHNGSGSSRRTGGIIVPFVVCYAALDACLLLSR